jgi:hypothetical protein
MKAIMKRLNMWKTGVSPKGYLVWIQDIIELKRSFKGVVQYDLVWLHETLDYLIDRGESKGLFSLISTSALKR